MKLFSPILVTLRKSQILRKSHVWLSSKTSPHDSICCESWVWSWSPERKKPAKHKTATAHKTSLSGWPVDSQKVCNWLSISKWTNFLVWFLQACTLWIPDHILLSRGNENWSLWSGKHKLMWRSFSAAFTVWVHCKVSCKIAQYSFHKRERLMKIHQNTEFMKMFCSYTIWMTSRSCYTLLNIILNKWFQTRDKQSISNENSRSTSSTAGTGNNYV